MNLDGDALREAIDEAIAEIDRVEEEMLELIAELLGPDAAVRVVDYARAQEERSPLRGLEHGGSAPERYPADPPSPNSPTPVGDQREG